MRQARELKLSGVIASAVTPHRADTLEADFSGSLDLLDFIATGGVASIAVLDAAGEFLNYSLADRERLVYLGVKRCTVPLLAGVSHPTIDGAVQLANEAVSSGADGLLLMPPQFFRYGQAEIEEFCREFAAQTSDAVPLVIHNAPEWTSAIDIDTVARLVSKARFSGVIDSSGDRQYFEGLLALRQSHYAAVLCGSDRLAAHALAAGADGLFSIAAGAVPELMNALVHNRNARVQAFVHELSERLAAFPVPAAIKAALVIRGQKVGGSLVPLAAQTTAALNEFAAWFKVWLPTVLSEVRT